MGGFCDHRRQGRLRAVASAGPLDPGTRLIAVKGGLFALVDACDYEMLSKYQWYARHTPTTCYAVTQLKGRETSMHRLIMDAPKGLIVDHIDHNGMNNRRKNLRLCTAAQNIYNCRPRKGNTSEYKSVSWNTAKKKFCAKISFDRKQYSLGYFTDEKEAARAYDKKANEFFGEFAYLNFPADCAEGVSGDKSADSRWRRRRKTPNGTSRRKKPKKPPPSPKKSNRTNKSSPDLTLSQAL